MISPIAVIISQFIQYSHSSIAALGHKQPFTVDQVAPIA